MLGLAWILSMLLALELGQRRQGDLYRFTPQRCEFVQTDFRSGHGYVTTWECEDAWLP